MDKRTFSDIVSENFQEIERNFRAGLKAKGYEYDEDLMHDAFISCHSALLGRELTKQEAIKYYWTSYVNKFKTFADKQSKAPTSIPDDYEECDSDPYNTTTDEIYAVIIGKLCDKYGVRKTMLWEMYACEGLSPKEIRDMGLGKDVNFIYLSRQIKRFIYKHIIPDDKRLRELIDCRKGA